MTEVAILVRDNCLCSYNQQNCSHAYFPPIFNKHFWNSQSDGYGPKYWEKNQTVYIVVVNMKLFLWEKIIFIVEDTLLPVDADEETNLCTFVRLYQGSKLKLANTNIIMGNIVKMLIYNSGVDSYCFM